MRQGFTLIELMIVIAIIAIIASIAIPNLLESRVSANEAAASGTLKSGVFSAEIQFQSNGYQDIDADNVGEFGTLEALAGLEATNKVSKNSLHLLQGQLAVAANWSGTGTLTDPKLGNSNGYKLLAIAAAETNANTLKTEGVWAEGATAPATIAPATPIVQNANQGESYFIAAASPEKFGETGRRAFVITADGQLRSPSSAAGIGAFYNKAVTPDNGTAFKAADIAKGVHYAIKTALAVPALTDFDDFNNNDPLTGNFRECPVYAK